MTVGNGNVKTSVQGASVSVATGPLPTDVAPSRSWIADYFDKWKGGSEAPLPRESLGNILASWAGAFLSILAVGALDQYAGPRMHFAWLIASFGASAVLLFGVPAAKLSQPRNVIGGHTLAALCGILVRLMIQPQYGGGRADFVSAALGMSLSLSVMQATGTTHPPAGATALIAATADPIPAWRGFKFLLTALAGSCVMVAVALGVNNMVPGRRYPTFW